jgi:transposase
LLEVNKNSWKSINFVSEQKNKTMETSYIYHAHGIKDYECTKTVYKGNTIIHHLQKREEKIRCECCHSHVVTRNGFKIREIRTVNIGRKQVILQVKVQRLKCRTCGADVYEDLHFVTGKQRYTHRLARLAVELLHRMTIKDAAHYLGLSWDTVKDIHKNYLRHKFSHIELKDVRHIGIDEFAVRKGHDYLTIVVDMESGAIIHVGDGKGTDALEKFWPKLKRSGATIESVSSDMSAAFISAIRENLPGAVHVYDHFHVQKLAGEAMDRIRREVYHQESDLEKRKIIKGTRWLLLRHDKDAYTKDEKKRLDSVLRMNEPLGKAYILNEYLQEVWKQDSYEEGEAVLDDWIKQARESKVPTLVKLGNSIAAFRTGILAYYKCRTSNAKVEGINNKIKVLKRNAYGYRDIAYFKLRLFNLHNDKITRFVG